MGFYSDFKKGRDMAAQGIKPILGNCPTCESELWGTPESVSVKGVVYCNEECAKSHVARLPPRSDDMKRGKHPFRQWNQR